MGLTPAFSHSWNLTPSDAIRLQLQLSKNVVQEDRFGEVKRIAAADVAFPQKKARAVVCLFSYPQLELVEQTIIEEEIVFPYVPGLLSFRETPPLLSAFRRLKGEPDLLIIDGQGVAHPRRFGIASHIGILLDKPTIGCAKTVLFGRPASDLGQKRGATTELIGDDGEVIGMLLRTKDGVKPLVVSVGHKISLASAVKFVLTLCGKYRIPEPQRIADALSKHHPIPKTSRLKSSKSLFS